MTHRIQITIDANDPALLAERRRAVDAAADALATLGATRGAALVELGTTWTVMHDPEGNEFCLT